MRRLKNFFLSEKMMMGAILANAIVIFVMSFPNLWHDPLLEGLDQFFILLFLIEAIVKISVLSPKTYFNNHWNKFDFFIVVASLPSLLMWFFPIANTSLVTILRLFRLIRFIRLVRFIEFVPNLAKVLEGIGRAMKASILILLALFFLNFMLSIFTCHMYAEIAPKYFGNPLISAYSIFQLFTIEGWNEIPGEIAKNTPEDDTWSYLFFIGFTRFYFVIIVLIGGIFGMSLANAVFVDEMTLDNNRELEDRIEDLTAEIKEIKQLLLDTKTEPKTSPEMDSSELGNI